LLDTREIILLYPEKLEREKIIKDKFALGSKESKRGPHIAGGFSEFESNLQLLAGGEIRHPAQPLQLRQKRAAATGVLVPRRRTAVPHVPRRQHPPQRPRAEMLLQGQRGRLQRNGLPPSLVARPPPLPPAGSCRHVRQVQPTGVPKHGRLLRHARRLPLLLAGHGHGRRSDGGGGAAKGGRERGGAVRLRAGRSSASTGCSSGRR
ncbi:Os05g0422200, partial [Oryza sativa Japonica Group]